MNFYTPADGAIPEVYDAGNAGPALHPEWELSKSGTLRTRES